MFLGASREFVIGFLRVLHRKTPSSTKLGMTALIRSYLAKRYEALYGIKNLLQNQFNQLENDLRGSLMRSTEISPRTKKDASFTHDPSRRQARPIDNLLSRLASSRLLSSGCDTRIHVVRQIR